MKNSALIGLLLLGCLLLLTQGTIPFPDVLEGIGSRLVGLGYWNPLLDERLPRLLVILCTGASLAVSGVVMQALFQNPLASPSVLGISLGGSLAVFLVFLWRLHAVNPFFLAVGAFLGCIVTLLIVYALSLRRGHYLLLTGLAISTFLAAIQGALIYVFRDQWQLIQGWMEWEAGSTIDRTWNHVHQELPLTLVGLFVVLRYRKELNLLSLGETEALSLGVDVPKIRFRLFLAVALLTAGSLAGCGIIPFFGLILPHILRMIVGAEHRVLLKHAMLVGAASMVYMDWLLRYLHIHMLSIGQVSAFIGGLFFLFLVFWQRREDAPT